MIKTNTIVVPEEVKNIFLRLNVEESKILSISKSESENVYRILMASDVEIIMRVPCKGKIGFSVFAHDVSALKADRSNQMYYEQNLESEVISGILWNLDNYIDLESRNIQRVRFHSNEFNEIEMIDATKNENNLVESKFAYLEMPIRDVISGFINYGSTSSFTISCNMEALDYNRQQIQRKRSNNSNK